ncbi:hypothetical protein EDD85DRAFT_809542 [Armillaria nabsnona]|nr:hypothetical protein EDD85DRAFT_809542 [Armillaria nabsnona]
MSLFLLGYFLFLPGYFLFLPGYFLFLPGYFLFLPGYLLHFVMSSFPPSVYPRLNATGSSP